MNNTIKLLPKNRLADSKRYITTHCNELIQALYLHFIVKEDRAGVMAALSAYQNNDGGFGHNLEGDFELPDSSPMATSIAFQMLSAVGASEREPLVRNGIRYLVNSFQSDRNGWICVPPEVNDYPHADWWRFIESEEGTVIDRTWGNPTAELAGYLLRYKKLAPGGFVEPLYERTLRYLKDHPGNMEMHELYCFLRLAEAMPPADFQSVKTKLTHLVLEAVATDANAWRGYSAQPLDFVQKPDSFLYEPLKREVEMNLDFWIDTLQPDGIWFPAWTWEKYPQAWEKARIQISGRMTVARLKIIKQFNRLEL
jgi:hypothetical protein